MLSEYGYHKNNYKQVCKVLNLCKLANENNLHIS